MGSTERPRCAWCGAPLDDGRRWWQDCPGAGDLCDECHLSYGPPRCPPPSRPKQYDDGTLQHPEKPPLPEIREAALHALGLLVEALEDEIDSHVQGDCPMDNLVELGAADGCRDILRPFVLRKRPS